VSAKSASSPEEILPDPDGLEGSKGLVPVGVAPMSESVTSTDSPSLVGVPDSSSSDQELLDGIRAGSDLHFSELYDRYFQRIYNFVFARTRNHAETEEIVQETFLAVFRSFQNYRGQSSLLSWVYGIAKNTTNNSLRRTKSQQERVEIAFEEDLVPRPSIEEGMPDEQLDLRRFREVLSERLGSLAAWQAEIFEMRHFENLSIPEISARTSRSSDAVRSSLYRVKRMFIEAAEHSNASGQVLVAVGGAAR
jgi:RNA polymerase sigma-70 factor (ECF subfamily)